MDSVEFKKEFLEEVRAFGLASGEGSSAAFTSLMAEKLIECETLSNFVASYYSTKIRNRKIRLDGYDYDEFDGTLSIIVADYDALNSERKMTASMANHIFAQIQIFVEQALQNLLKEKIEISTPCYDLVELIRKQNSNIKKYRILIFTNAEISTSLKEVQLDKINGLTVEGQIWDIDRMYRVCVSDLGRQSIEVDFRDYGIEGIPCLEASNIETNTYKSYLGIISGKVLADLYDRYGSKLLEGNVRSFLSTKVAVNKKIRNTILQAPDMFFAYNNGISCTGMDVEFTNTSKGRFITKVKDLQIINGGQTTASISSARFKDKSSLKGIYVQMKLTEISGGEVEETDELIKNISKSSNSQNKVSEADFFASHPFHRAMEKISRSIFAPATQGAQYETRWFYERARGQYLQEQMRLTQAKKRQFQMIHPKSNVITKTELAKVQNAWRGFPHVVSKGAQTNFSKFAEYIDVEWSKSPESFNKIYFQQTAALVLMFKYLEKHISKKDWYQGGYRANIIYYTVALFRRLINSQFDKAELNLNLIWNRQMVPTEVGLAMLDLAKRVFDVLTDEKRPIINVTQYCKQEACWNVVKGIKFALPEDISPFLLTSNEVKQTFTEAKKDQKLTNTIMNEVQLCKLDKAVWLNLESFVKLNNLATVKEIKALEIVKKMPMYIPSEYQWKALGELLKKAKEEGFIER
ncbi:MAG: AIPR family protein [Veillonella sp.]|uniref:AIPR family protein n=1 Tax=Veillonella sp. TaxID=1926307 RepID=UPI0025D58152|nr:AIPR family protein [Veillonella sp.]MBS4913478.1 AIPR family protein [Veillonella sp.]